MEMTTVKITPSEVIEYVYCPRFIYFMSYLQIPQHEEQHYKVQVGRDIHQIKESLNKDYLRKRLNVKEKLISQTLGSDRYHIYGIVDEVLFMDDGTAAPLDYKFAEYDGKVYQTYKYQIVMYGLLIEDNFGTPVNKGYLIYTRSKNKLVQVDISTSDRAEVMQTIQTITQIIDKGYFPEATSSTKRCEDCCYRNICVR